ncbi:MAG: M48 family metallopeptidase [Bacteroidetes bacterium]|nr:M48 family metallopeptidase [Bacteroidota bacterium]
MHIKILTLFVISIGLSISAVTNGYGIQADVTTIEYSEIFDPLEASQEYLNTLSPEAKAKSDAYFEGGYWLILWKMFYAILLGWVFLAKGVSSRIKRLALKVKNVNLQNLIYATLYLLVAYILTLPFNIYQNFFREHQYELSNLSFGAWFGEEMTSLTLSVFLVAPLTMGLYKAIRSTGSNWWIWGGGVSVIVIVFLIQITPVFINPLFNEYKPLEDEKIKVEILAMARANSVPADNVYQFDASKQTKRISANVSGMGNTIRLSLNDNLLNRSTPAEIKSVMGHELGHYVLNHIQELIIYLGLLVWVGFWFVHWSFQKVLDRWGSNWNVSGISDIGGLPLIILLFTFYFFLTTPVFNTIIRTNEEEADIFGLNAAREPDGFASIAMKLSEYRKIDPGYWEEIIFFDHPSGRERVLSAMKWKAENLKK